MKQGEKITEICYTVIRGGIFHTEELHSENRIELEGTPS